MGMQRPIKAQVKCNCAGNVQVCRVKRKPRETAARYFCSNYGATSSNLANVHQKKIASIRRISTKTPTKPKADMKIAN